MTGAAVAALLLVIYGTYLQSDFVLWDDDFLIVQNPLIRSLSFASIWTAFTSYDPELYIPLTFLSYQLNYLIGGLNPFIYHLTNLLLHAVNALLVTGIAYKLSSKTTWIAVVCGLLFAVHPLHTEAVMWASARKDVLASTFFLSSLLLYLERERAFVPAYIGSILAFFLALLSKVSAITLPLVLLLIDWREHRQWNRTMIMEKIPYFLLSIAFGIIALFGKTQQVAESTLLETILVMVKGIVFYMQKLFVPLHLSPLYPYIGEIQLSEPAFLVPVIILAALYALAVFALRLNRDLLFALLFFVITVAASALNFRKGEGGDIYFASDRYAYLASFSVIFLVCVFLYHVREKIPALISTGVIAIAVATLSFLSYTQAAIWSNSETLFTAVIASYPNAQAAHHNLGVLYQQRGQTTEAMAAYERAIMIAPKASSESNIGDMWRELGESTLATQHYQRALALNASSVDAYLGMGLLHLQSGNTGAAIIAFQKVTELAPADPRGHLNLGAALLRAKRTDEAIAEYEKAIELDPLSAAAHFNLAVALDRIGQTDEADQYFQRAVELDPEFAEAVEAAR